MSDSPRPHAAVSHTTIGAAPGQTRLVSGGGIRPLGTTGSVLPELAEAPERERKWWLHPAFIVSVSLTVLALLAAAAWFVISALTDDSARVTGLTITEDAGNAHLDWSGPDADYSLYAVHGNGDVVDLTQLVLSDTEVWIPSAMGVYERDTCFVVRPTAVTGDVSLDAATLDGQRGQSACVADLAE